MLTEKQKKIGVLDSGLGGLTVVKELEQLLPRECIAYYGDNRNCPYGNRSADDIVEIAKGILSFLQEKEIKAMVLACNTTSSLIARFESDFPFPVFSIIRPAAKYAARLHPAAVGVIATELTIRTGSYERLIREEDAGIAVYGEASPNLASLIDCGEFDMRAIEAEAGEHLGKLLSRAPVKHIIYGCTHYPIVGDVFERLAPDVTFINPAREQARAVADYLDAHNLLNSFGEGGFDLYTSGSETVYRAMLERLGIRRPARFFAV